MSAWIVSDRHINILATAAAKYGTTYKDPNNPDKWKNASDDPQAVVNVLVAENYKSVNYRYGESNDPRYVRYQRVDLPELGALIKACHCYDYQACEHPKYDSSLAKTIVALIIDGAISELPGYDEAPWIID